MLPLKLDAMAFSQIVQHRTDVWPWYIDHIMHRLKSSYVASDSLLLGLPNFFRFGVPKSSREVYEQHYDYGVECAASRVGLGGNNDRRKLP